MDPLFTSLMVGEQLHFGQDSDFRLVVFAQQEASTWREPYTGSRALVREAYYLKNLSTTAVDIITSSISVSTQKQHGLKMLVGVLKNHVFNATIPIILEFLTDCYEAGISYGTLNSAKSAIALINSPGPGNEPIL